LKSTGPFLAVASILLAGCQLRIPPPEADQCPAFSYVDQARLPTHLNDDPADVPFEEVWTAWANRDPGLAWRTPNPEAAFHVTASPGALSEDPTEREIIGRRSGRSWEIYARSYEPRTWSERDQGEWRAIRLSREGEAALAAILRDPCLWSAPRFLDDEVPLLNGRYDSRPDGPSTTYDIVQGDRRWGGWHFSWTVGAPGRLRVLLLREAFGLREQVDPDIGPEGWIDRPS
jgi:hypothetical protein